MMRNICFLLLLMFLPEVAIYSNEIKKPIFYIGGEVDLGFNIHFADFNKLQNIPNCCPRYTNTLGLGWNISLLAQKELSEKFALRLIGGLNSEGVTFKENEFIGNTPVKYEEDVSQIVLLPVTVQHFLAPKLIGLYVEPVLMYKIFDRLWLTFGLNFSNLFLTKVDQKEVIISPNSVVFVNGEKERNVNLNLEIPNVKKFLVRPSLGLSYDIQLFDAAWISPQLRFLIPFQNLTNENWKISHLDIGISARFPIYSPPEVHYYYDTMLVRDTLRIAVFGLKSERTYLEETVLEKTIKEKVSDGYIYKTFVREKYRTEVPKISQLETKLKVVGKSKQGEVQNNPVLVIEEFETEEMFPLLPYIYFPTGEWSLESSSVNLIDKSTTDGFDESFLPWNTLKIYENLLNIIAKRLKQNPKESIVLTGCNSNIGVELNNLELSQKRALAVKEYLVETWGIEPERIDVKFRNLPEKMTNPSIPEGIEENQRVEIFSKSGKITGPVRLSKIEKVANPPFVEILPEIHSDASLKGWNLTIEQSGTNLRTYSGIDLPEKILWSVEEEPIPKLEEPILINFIAEDILDQRSISKVSVKIEQRTIKRKREELLGDKKIERFSLIVFDFDKADLLPQHIPILNQIKSKIAPNSKVTISGFTDKIGEVSYNKDLALRRCLAVKNFLQLPDSQVVLNPVGNEILLYDNSLPQGRSYCRTVHIIIETPVK